MRNIILVLAAFTWMCNCHAQYFAPSGTTWHYGEEIYFNWPNVIGYMEFNANGDTIIDGKNCQVISKQNQLWCNGRPDTEYTYYANDTVYFYDTSYSKFQVLYDFNSSPGEYWEILVLDNGVEDDTVRVTVDSVDMVIINGASLKRMHVTYQLFGEEAGSPYSYKSAIIERLGDTMYMFNFFPEFNFVCDANGSRGLRCYEDSIIGFYDSPNPEQCTYEAFSGITELNSSQRSLLRIVDLMGRETEPKPNTLLIYVYSDGTVEKVLRVEL